MATHLAGIVIERARAVEQLRVAKVAAEQRAQEITQAYDALRTTQEALNAELAGAVDYVLSLLPRPITEERVSADWFMIISAQLGGDGLGYHWMDSERFAFYLLDVSGPPCLRFRSLTRSARVVWQTRIGTIPVQCFAS